MKKTLIYITIITGVIITGIMWYIMMTDIADRWETKQIDKEQGLSFLHQKY